MADASDIAPYLIGPNGYFHALNLQMMAALGRSMPGSGRRIDLVITSFDRGLLHRWWDERSGWHPRWEPRGGEWASRAAVVSPAPDRLDVFALGLSGDLFHAWCAGDCTASGRWQIARLGRPEDDRLVSHPTALVEGNRVKVFVRGERAPFWVLTLDAAGSVRRSWRNLGGEGLAPWPTRARLAFAPAAASWEEHRIDLFAVHQRSATLYHAWREDEVTGPQWERPRTPRGRTVSGALGLTSSPDAVAWPRTGEDSLGVLHVVACGPMSIAGPTLTFTSWLGRHWTSPRALFRPDAVSSAALASWGKPRLDLFYVGVVPGGSYVAGPFVPVHLWTENLRTWSQDPTDLGRYPVQYFPSG